MTSKTPTVARKIAAGLLVVAVAAVVVIYVVFVGRNSSATATPRPTPNPSVITTAPIIPAPYGSPVEATAPPIEWDLDNGETLSWALAQISTGHILDGSPVNDPPYPAENMIDGWLGADYLAQHPDTATGTRVDEIARMIRQHDTDAADDIYGSADDGDLSIARMIETCGLTHTGIVHNEPAQTLMTAADAARLGVCLANGTAAGPKWTPWLMQQMRTVVGGVDQQQPGVGGGRWGVVDGLPGAQVASSNGWAIVAGKWHVNCLGIVNGTWSLAVMIVYPQDQGLSYGQMQCAALSSQLATP